MSDEMQSESLPPITALTRGQRRVLGVLIEKGLTTPDQYPLTLKSTTSGCNQKNNRDPVTNYSEDDVIDILNELRELGLVAAVHTESGRTERYRHYFRRRFTVSEPQVAIMGELLLRGQQTLGELRTRASRMVPIDTLPALRTELAGLVTLKMVRSNDDFERRGVVVDHDWYQPREAVTLPPRSSSDDDDSPNFTGAGASSSGANRSTPPSYSGGSHSGGDRQALWSPPDGAISRSANMAAASVGASSAGVAGAVGQAAGLAAGANVAGTNAAGANVAAMAGGVAASTSPETARKIANLESQVAELREQLDAVRSELRSVQSTVEDLRSALGS